MPQTKAAPDELAPQTLDGTYAKRRRRGGVGFASVAFSFHATDRPRSSFFARWDPMPLDGTQRLKPPPRQKPSASGLGTPAVLDNRPRNIREGNRHLGELPVLGHLPAPWRHSWDRRTGRVRMRELGHQKSPGASLSLAGQVSLTRSPVADRVLAILSVAVIANDGPCREVAGRTIGTPPVVSGRRVGRDEKHHGGCYRRTSQFCWLERSDHGPILLRSAPVPSGSPHRSMTKRFTVAFQVTPESLVGWQALRKSMFAFGGYC
jgi:hypothetical protein